MPDVGFVQVTNVDPGVAVFVALTPVTTFGIESRFALVV
jgi:hypothetical protein